MGFDWKCAGFFVRLISLFFNFSLFSEVISPFHWLHCKDNLTFLSEWVSVSVCVCVCLCVCAFHFSWTLHFGCHRPWALKRDLFFFCVGSKLNHYNWTCVTACGVWNSVLQKKTFTGLNAVFHSHQKICLLGDRRKKGTPCWCVEAEWTSMLNVW